jgi:hypothetical protein
LPLLVTAKLPAKSSGRLLDALTDIIRPFTERRGLRADMIRLQREEVLIKIGELALDHIQSKGKKIRPIPNKGLVPLLEKASLESLSDKTMIDHWANLLASAALGDHSRLPRHVTILSEINGKQARLLQRIMLRGDTTYARHPEALFEDLWASDHGPILLDLKQAIPETARQEEGSAAMILAEIEDLLNVDGLALSDIVVGRGEEQLDLSAHKRVRKGSSWLDADRYQVDLSVLEASTY